MFLFTTPATSETSVRELDHRLTDGIEVQLLWDPRADRVLVAVEDQRTGEYFEFDVPGADAMQAFHHPYAYCRRGDHDDHTVSA